MLLPSSLSCYTYGFETRPRQRSGEFNSRFLFNKCAVLVFWCPWLSFSGIAEFL
jgi:hypothetical protein